MRPILVVAQGPETAKDLIRTARHIRSLAGPSGDIPDIRIVLAAEEAEESALSLARETGLDIIFIEAGKGCSWERLKLGLMELVKGVSPFVILFAHTTFARETAPALAFRLNGVSVSNVSAVGAEGTDWRFTRPVMDNTRVQEVRVPKDRLSVLSISLGGERYKEGVDITGPAGKVTRFQLPRSDEHGVTRLGLRSRDQGGDDGFGQDLKEAPIVVALGQGIGDKEGIEQAADFARAFPRAALAASRPLVDQGWIPYSRQVGITGARVAPDLYIALGISGSSQHLAGMAGSKWVVSVNKHLHAPICANSDLCIIGDLFDFIEGYLSGLPNKK